MLHVLFNDTKIIAFTNLTLASSIEETRRYTAAVGYERPVSRRLHARLS